MFNVTRGLGPTSAVGILLSVGGVAWFHSPQTALAQTQPSVRRTDLRLAQSVGGGRFVPGDGVLAENACSPELARVGKRDLLILFDALDTDGLSRLCAARSNDEGRHWTSAKSVRFRSPKSESAMSARGMQRARHSDLLPVSGGRLRLYFTDDDPTTGRCVIRSAVTANGADFTVDPMVRLTPETPGDVRATTVRLGDRIHLYVCPVAAGQSSGGRAAATSRPADARTDGYEHFVSRDGRRFESAGRVRFGDAAPGAGIVVESRAARAYVQTGKGIRSAVSGDGEHWRLEPDVCLADGWDSAVVRLRDTSYLMAYAEPAATHPRHVHALIARRGGRDGGRTAKAMGTTDAATPGTAKPEAGEGSSADAAGGPDETSDAANTDPDAAAWADFASNGESQNDGVDETGSLETAEASNPNDLQPRESATTQGASPDETDLAIKVNPQDAAAAAELSPEEVQAQAERQAAEWRAWLETPDPPARSPGENLPPLPDFNTPVNYGDWFARLVDNQVTDNAYWAYAEFLPDPSNPNRRDNWPELSVLYNQADFKGEAAPWDPKAKPDWEASLQASRGLLEQFAAATRHSGYGRPVQFRPEDATDSPTGQPLLISLLLPDLSAHRALVKQTLGAGWRVGEDGKVSPDAMLDGWKTSLGSANHLNQGMTLIEQLVGVSEQSLVEKDARSALKQGVFSGDQYERALEVLQQRDRPQSALDHTLVGEQAMVLDLMQALFKADAPGAPPRPNAAAIDKVIPLISDDPAMRDQLKVMTPADIKRTVGAFETYYRDVGQALRTGYPQVRAKDISEIDQRLVGTSAFANSLAPSMARVHQLRTRNEASRRATQLAYALHAYKSQTGKWPASLDDLPAKYGQTLRTDPFTGQAFGYRLGNDGPVVYSRSENGRDDGGVHAPTWSDDKSSESDDYVFWPPQEK